MATKTDVLLEKLPPTLRRYRSLIKLACEQAYRSNCPYRLGAIVFKSKRIYGVGHNHDSACWQMAADFRSWRWHKHAEVAALTKSSTLAGCSLLVVRVRKRGELGMAKPCGCCQQFFKHFGVRKVFFSTGTDTVIESLRLE